MKLYQSEMPGPFKEERLTPRLADTAEPVAYLYAAGGACTLAFLLAGMPFFDALCHGLSTVSLGGFSTHTESIGYYQSDAIELVAGAFSLLSALNFTLYFVAIARRSLKPFRRSTEMHFFSGRGAGGRGGHFRSVACRDVQPAQIVRPRFFSHQFHDHR